MPGEKAPSLGAFLQASLKYFLSGKPMHNLSGVDTVVQGLGTNLNTTFTSVSSALK